MNVGIITFHAVPNYGAVLQLYALIHVLKNLGHTARVIHYCPTDELSGKIRCRSGFFGIHPADLLLRYRKRKFIKFSQKFIPQTETSYTTLDQLNNIDEFEAFICGSDQIWNPDLTGGSLDPAFFLSFANRQLPRVAYAASSGGYEFIGTDVERGLLEHLSSISVRERTLLRSIKGITNKEVSYVLDPTLLPVDYTEIMSSKRVKRGDYILLYALQASEHIYTCVKRLSQITGLPIVSIGCKVNFVKHPGQQVCASPAEFLNLFAHARYVVTNSFHGTVFSVIFQKIFISCALTGHVEKRNIRMINLLGSLGLDDSFFEVGKKLNESTLHELKNMDRRESGVLLEKMRSVSLEFLRHALGKKV